MRSKCVTANSRVLTGGAGAEGSAVAACPRGGAADDGRIADRQFMLDEGQCQRFAHQAEQRLGQRLRGNSSSRVDYRD